MTNIKCQNQINMNNKYNLNELIAGYGKTISSLCTSAKSWNDRVICSQLLWSGISLGNGYIKEDSENKINYKIMLKETKKELKESKYWLDILRTYNYEPILVQEAYEEMSEITRIVLKK